MERGALVCPFCGALYRGSIPSDAVQVKCKYCGGVIVVPRLEGIVPRCPNHSDAFAIGLCNDCHRSFCERCLYILTVTGYDVNIYVCPNCLEKRHVWFQTPITVYEKRRKRAKVELPPTSEDTYEKLLDVYTRIYGGIEAGKTHLEKKIKFYLKKGFDREGAIRKVAEGEGYKVREG